MHSRFSDSSFLLRLIQVFVVIRKCIQPKAGLENIVIFMKISKISDIFDIYSVSQKSSPLKLFAIFSLRLSIFP